LSALRGLFTASLYTYVMLIDCHVLFTAKQTRSVCTDRLRTRRKNFAYKRQK